MTELAPAPSGRFVTSPLVSEFVITDGARHHVAFVWDGSPRRLYADGVEVANDDSALDSLAPSRGGLHIGANGNPDVAGFWSGLIDEIRTYNQAVAP